MNRHGFETLLLLALAGCDGGAGATIAQSIDAAGQGGSFAGAPGDAAPGGRVTVADARPMTDAVALADAALVPPDAASGAFDAEPDAAAAAPECDFDAPDRTNGLRRCLPGASNGYLLFPHKHRGDVYLIDRLGRVVHQWSQSRYEPGQSCYLRPNGNLVRAAMNHASNIGGGEGGRVEEYDWDDLLVWAFDFSTDAGTTHHDFKIMPNGHLLMLAVERKDAAAAAEKGFQVAGLRDGYVAPELVVEIAPTPEGGHEVVWTWHVWDHLIQDRDRALANYGTAAQNPGKLLVTGNAPAFWNHGNSIDYNAELDQIVISARSHNELWVIDHGTTTAEAATGQGGRRGHGGDFLYRWGNPSTYGAGTAADRTLFNQHDVQWIPPGLPGAGHLLVFNNGLDRPGGNYSTLDELVSPVLPDGSYPAVAPGEAWGPTALAWQFTADPPTDFYGSEISGTQRLPNGNTMACEGTSGRFFEVTPDGRRVWEYVNPVANVGPMAQYELSSLDPKGHPENAVFKTHWYPADFAGFADKDLRPGEVLERDDTACPGANPSYACRPDAECTRAGGQAVTEHFTCGGGGDVCCFLRAQEMPR